MNKGKKILYNCLTALFIIALTLFILSFAIGLPIYCRFFYYIQINTLNLPDKTGYSYAEIKEAYDNCLDFCTLPWIKEFSTYPLEWTEEEAAHFADCKKLFMLDFWVLVCSFIITSALTVLDKCKVIKLSRPCGHGAYFYAAIAAVILPVTVIILVLIAGFDNAFATFHKIFFPGKENWVFDPRTEQIINVMPEEFFLNCAIIIAVGIIVFASALLVADIVIRKQKRKKS